MEFSGLRTSKHEVQIFLHAHVDFSQIFCQKVHCPNLSWLPCWQLNERSRKWNRQFVTQDDKKLLNGWLSTFMAVGKLCYTHGCLMSCLLCDVGVMDVKRRWWQPMKISAIWHCLHMSCHLNDKCHQGLHKIKWDVFSVLFGHFLSLMWPSQSLTLFMVIQTQFCGKSVTGEDAIKIRGNRRD